MNQIKNLAIVFMIGIIASSCGQKHNLSAEIEDLGNDTIFVEYAPVSQFYEMEEPLRDTIISVNGKFIYDSPLNEPILAFIFPKKGAFTRVTGSQYRPQHKYLVLLIKPNDRLTINGRLHKFYLDYEVKGSDFNENYSRLRKGYIKEVSLGAKIELQLDTLMANKGDKEQINNLFKERRKANAIAGTKQLEYIKNNLNAELSAFYLTRQSLDTLAKYYENLDREIKNGIFKNMLESQHLRFQKYTKVREAEKNIVEGKIAPNFSLKTLSGSDFELNSIQGKYVVLDFWGSWCGWCIKGFPKMKEYYNKYKAQVEIIGVACSDTEDKWKKSVEENELNWLQVINDKDINKDVSVMYAVQGYPTKIILDKDKKIIAKFIGESDDFYEKLDELMKN
ncbi:TlpA family protein disulfide reductase [Marinifilum caeruleilacunae]|uniref:AhpC/TSA family protein n=1 Tax=Marinifilum caeruleilacunae TaxID=2499076 RepID=A0ABX1WU50_9BACT|nr:TlpA disulfide reductase family protein [Marinifilum caeruleilacunae]NOU59634.1 AhpC/TSA family protein [Marinifilum caeruleilacunae]